MITAFSLLAALALPTPAATAAPMQAPCVAATPHGAPATPSLAPSIAPSIAPATAVPSVATPSPSTPSAATPSPTPTPTPSPFKYRFVPHYAAHLSAGVPQIYAVYLNDKRLHSLGPIRIKVETTPNVVKVISRSNGRDGVIPLVSPGDFEVTSVLPKIPFIATGMTLDLEFVATTADGRKSVVRVPVRLD